MKINNIIVAPVLTEKATNLVKKQVYMFEVNLKANKFQIKEVIEKIYKVKVDDVRVMLRKGKSKRAGRRMTTMKLSDKKIAFVKLKEGIKPSEKLKEQIQQFIKTHLAAHAYPREIEFIDKLPKTRSGKIMRRVLRSKELGLPIGDTSTLEEF